MTQVGRQYLLQPFQHTSRLAMEFSGPSPAPVH
jgi:hypothetical protein